MRGLVCGVIRFYQRFLSAPLHFLGGPGSGCRFVPTCSEYCLRAVRRHGVLRGGWLGLRRVLRCHPWGGCGFDPVPGEEADGVDGGGGGVGVVGDKKRLDFAAVRE